MLEGAIVEPDYPPTETAVSAKNEAARKAILDWLEPQIADRPDLRPAGAAVIAPGGEADYSRQRRMG